MAKVGHVRWGCVWIDRAADQRERAGLRFGVFFGQIGGCRQSQRRGLADSNNMGVRAEFFHEVDQIKRVILDIKLAFADRNVAGVVPIGDIDFAVRQQGFHGRAQQCCVVARHRRYQKHLTFATFAPCDREVDEIAERLFDHGFHLNHVVLAIFAGKGLDVPVRLHDHTLEGAFGDFAPGFHPLKSRGREERKHRVGRHRPRGRTVPFIGIADRFHQIIGGHITHWLLLVCTAMIPIKGV